MIIKNNSHHKICTDFLDRNNLKYDVVGDCMYNLEGGVFLNLKNFEENKFFDAIIAAAWSAGHKNGREKVQREIRTALGLFD